MKSFLLPFAVLTTLTLHSAKAEELMIQKGSEMWNEIYEPDSTSPTEVERSNPLRKQLFDLARPDLEKTAGKPILFNGRLQAYRNWALFVGASEDKEGNPIAYPGDGNSDTVALFLRTTKGWVLVDCSGGHSDVFYEIWIEQYGMPRELL